MCHMQMSNEIKVHIQPTAGGPALRRFSTERGHKAGKVIAHLTRIYGEGIFRDAWGADVSPDSGNLQPGEYYFTWGSCRNSLNCGWQVHPRESHLLYTNDVNGLGRFQHLTYATIPGQR